MSKVEIKPLWDCKPETTIIYTHITRKGVQKIRSLFNNLYDEHEGTFRDCRNTNLLKLTAIPGNSDVKP